MTAFIEMNVCDAESSHFHCKGRVFSSARHTDGCGFHCGTKKRTVLSRFLSPSHTGATSVCVFSVPLAHSQFSAVTTSTELLNDLYIFHADQQDALRLQSSYEAVGFSYRVFTNLTLFCNFTSLLHLDVTSLFFIEK